MCCTSPDASGCSGEKEFIGARNALFMVLARALRLESGTESRRFRTEVGSVRVADCIPTSLLTSFHHLQGGAISQMFNFGPVVCRATGRKLASSLQANPV